MNTLETVKEKAETMASAVIMLAVVITLPLHLPCFVWIYCLECLEKATEQKETK